MTDTRVASAALCVATALAACSAQDSGSTKVTLGDEVLFNRMDNGARLAEIKFLAIQRLPAACIAEDQGGITLAIQVEIVNAPDEQWAIPGARVLEYNDGSEMTVPVGDAAITGCDTEYPRAVTAPPGGRASGWFAVRTRFAPKELYYWPKLGDQAALRKRENPVSPQMITLTVPDLGTR